MADPEVIERLDLIIGLLNLAFEDSIDKARTTVLADPVSAAVLEALSAGPMSASALQAAVKAATKQSERTITRRLADLINRRFVIRRGTGAAIQYRSAGLIAVGRRAAAGDSDAGDA